MEFEYFAGDLIVVDFVGTGVDEEGAAVVRSSGAFELCTIFKEFAVELSVVVDVVKAEARLPCEVRLGVIDDGVTNKVVDEGVGAAENGFGTNESMTPIGPSCPIPASLHVSSSG